MAMVLLAVLASVAALATALVARRDAPEGGPLVTGNGLNGRRDGHVVPTPSESQARSALYRVARVVSFLFLAAVAVVVAVTRAWPATETAIFTLLAGGTLLVVLFLDMLPGDWLGRARRPVEGVGAVVFVGVLMGLTGGVSSPFHVGLYLIVAGTALSIEGLAPLVIALTAVVTMTVVSLVVSAASLLQAEGLAWVAFNAVALVLLADIATAAGRAQRQARDEALNLSRFDALTGLFNRSYLMTIMEQEVRRSSRMAHGFCMIMLDLDDLKPVNDTFGHPTGDRLLRAVAEAIQRTVRFTDSAARYGGDEFVVLLPETDTTGAYIVAEKLRRDIAGLSIRAADRHVRTSVSIGLVSFPEDGTTVEQLVAAADVAMYEAKRQGKNQIVGYMTRTERVATTLERERHAPVALGPLPGLGYRTLSVSESARGVRAEVAEGVPTTPAAASDASADVSAAPAPLEPAPAAIVSGEAPWLTRAGPAMGSSAASSHRVPPAAEAPARRDRAEDAEQGRGEMLRAPEQRPWVALPVESGETSDAEPPAR